MAQPELQPLTGKSKRKIHAALKIDMTPMVDLGFLLITFFIFTTTMLAKTSNTLIMPKDGPPIDVKASHTITAILGENNKVFVYEGIWQEAVSSNKIFVTGYDVYKGLGSFIRAKQKQLSQNAAKEKLVLLIKPLATPSYQNVVDALDETSINDVRFYSIVDATKEEKAFAGKL